MKCINCEIDLHYSRRLLVFELETSTISMIAEWVTPLIITETDYICQQCLEVAMKAINESGTSNICNHWQQKRVGHSKVCILCGRSVLKIPSELVLRTNPTTRQQQIHQLVTAKIVPRVVNSEDRLCHNCYRAAGCTVARMPDFNSIKAEQKEEPQEIICATPIQNKPPDQLSLQSSSSQSSDSEWLPVNVAHRVSKYTLRNYRRVKGSPIKCAVPQCPNIDTHIIS